jgi:hypothetical protein
MDRRAAEAQASCYGVNLAFAAVEGLVFARCGVNQAFAAVEGLVFTRCGAMRFQSLLGFSASWMPSDTRRRG